MLDGPDPTSAPTCTSHEVTKPLHPVRKFSALVVITPTFIGYGVDRNHVGPSIGPARVLVVTQARRIWLVLALNAAMIAALAIAGFASRSLGLLSEAGDFVADSAALGLGLLAIYLRDRRRNARATTWVALINATWLLALSVWVAVAAVVRLVGGSPEVHGLPVLVVSAVAAVVMLVAALILGADAGDEDLHMRSILLDTIADGAAAATVAIVGGVITVVHRWFWLDAAAGFLVALVIGFAAIQLLVDVVGALRAGRAYVPPNDD